MVEAAGIEPAQGSPRFVDVSTPHELSPAAAALGSAECNAVWWAMQLARDVDACAALLRGEPVDPDRLRPEWLAQAQEARLVRLDFRAIERFREPVDPVAEASARNRLLEVLQETDPARFQPVRRPVAA